MNTDIRIPIFWRDEPRFKKLESLLGAEGLVALITFWGWAGWQRSTGKLTGMDAREIAEASHWPGDAMVLLRAFKTCGFVIGSKGSYTLKDWEKDQGWASHAEDRIQIARENAQRKYSKPVNNLAGAPTPSPSPYPNPLPLRERRLHANPEKIEDTIGSLIQAQPVTQRQPAQQNLPLDQQIRKLIANLEANPNRTPADEGELEELRRKLQNYSGSAQ